MTSINIRFCRTLLKDKLDIVKNYFTKEEIQSAKVGFLTTYGYKKNYEFYIPKNKMLHKDVRMELWADNAYHARAIAWDYVLAAIGHWDRPPTEVHTVEGVEFTKEVIIK